MFWITLSSLVLAVISFALAVFLGKELIKKIRFHNQFAASEGILQIVNYSWPGRKPGMRRMRNIVLESDQPFDILIGFELVIPILNFQVTDWYGCLSAKKTANYSWRAVISTYMGRKPVNFRLLVKTPCEGNHHVVCFAENLEVQQQVFIPTAVYPPHWWQRLGFYG